MAERQGFMVYHDDANMLLSADDPTIGAFFRNLSEFSMQLDETGEIPLEVPFEGMTKGLFLAMRSKIIRDKNRYDDTVRENTIKGLISAIKRDYKSRRMSITDFEARQIAEERYKALANSCEQRLTTADNSELTVAERSEAEAVSVTEKENETLSVPETVAEAETVSVEWNDVLKAARDKAIPITSFNVISALNEEKGKTTCDAVIRRIKNDPQYVEYLRGLR